MTTPTKEQIKRLQKIFETKYGVWNEYWITAFITEWEKISNQRQNACTKKSCWYYCESNSDGCFLPENYQHRPTCFVSHKKAREMRADWEAKKMEDK